MYRLTFTSVMVVLASLSSFSNLRECDEIETRNYFSITRQERYFVLRTATELNPDSKKYDVAKRNKMSMALVDKAGYSSLTCNQNFSKAPASNTSFSKPSHDKSISCSWSAADSVLVELSSNGFLIHS